MADYVTICEPGAACLAHDCAICHSLPMTMTIPQWRVADRMRRAMDEAGYTTATMAADLGVSSESVSRWINGRGEARRTTLIAWAQLCQVPLTWLEHGDEERPPAEAEGLARPERLELPTFCSVADDELALELAFLTIVEQVTA